MFLEIVTPENILFSSKVDSVTVPGITGEFQILSNHAPVVSILKEGTVKIHIHTQNNLIINDLHESIVSFPEDDKVLTLAIKSGTVEMKDNKTIILAD